MISVRVLALGAAVLFLSAPGLLASDLSKYREFELDSGLVGVAQQVGMDPANAKALHQRPALIQELSWRADPTGSVEEIPFRFYDGEVSRMGVDHNRFNTKGLTAEDMIGTISEVYGAATRPAAEITLPSIYSSSESVGVIARWEDSQWSFNLVRSKYKPTFTLIAVSMHLDTLARTAAEEAVRLDRMEAPQKAIDLQKTEDEKKLLEQQKARVANRPDCRP